MKLIYTICSRAFCEEAQRHLISDWLQLIHKLQAYSTLPCN